MPFWMSEIGWNVHRLGLLPSNMKKSIDQGPIRSNECLEEPLGDKSSICTSEGQLNVQGVTIPIHSLMRTDLDVESLLDQFVSSNFRFRLQSYFGILAIRPGGRISFAKAIREYFAIGKILNIWELLPTLPFKKSKLVGIPRHGDKSDLIN